VTSYDEIYQTFLNNCMTEDINLPKTPEQQYQVIKNATMYFNNKLRTNLSCDDSTETVSEDLSDDHLIILANYIRLTFLINQKTYIESLWQPFSSDVGIKNFNTQIKSLENSISEQKNTIDYLIINTMEDFL
jgi:hypothetical protein